ncbi:MAG: protein kinase [Acidobacteria bacterium]|nr:protein kinase [Acidobacteriota bacterium]
MGEVYLAEDLNLGRRVALKLLPKKFTQDKERVRRFEQEARAASKLSHPNILTIYEIGEADGAHFMATEFIEGQTLRQRLARRRLPVDEALEIAIQIASALTAAHGAGITHRDIKPENIMLRDDGFVKVLDFGLAKLTESDFFHSFDPSVTQADTIEETFEDRFATAPLETHPDTSPGVILGTLSYMSPEQARGLKVDARTDIFSIGIVLFEMLAGRPPFEAPTTGDMMVAILDRDPPPLARFSQNAPDELEWIILKALAKDRDDRYQRTRSLLTDLRRLQKRLQYESSIDQGLEQSGSNLPKISREIRRIDSAEDSGGLLTDSGHIRTGAQRLSIAIDSLAVLPFTNASRDPNAEYLSDAIPESLIVNLSRLRQLRVMAWSTVRRYRNRDADALMVGRELEVRAIFTGRMYQFGENLVIHAELVDTSDGSQIWGGQYQRKLDDLINIEQEISQEICERLRLRLNDEEKQRLIKRYTENAAAYQAYLRGRYYWNQRTAKGLRKAMESFEEAIRLDESYAPAFTGLADCYCLLSIYSALPPKAAMPRAKAAALKALEIDDGIAEAHTSLAAALVWFEWDWEASEREFKRAIELNPSYAVAHHWYASVLLSAMGRHDEAMAEEMRARDLEPLSRVINSNLGFICYQAHRFDEAADYLKGTLEIDENFVYAHFILGLTYAHQKLFDEAIAEIKRAVELSGGRGALFTAALGYIYAIAGKHEEAIQFFEQLQTFPTNRDVSPFYLALIQAGLGNKEQALKWLEDACEERYNWVVWLKTEPMLEHLHGEERFSELLRRIGLAE